LAPPLCTLANKRQGLERLGIDFVFMLRSHHSVEITASRVPCAA